MPSANNLNPVTTQLDIDVYNDKDEKVHVTNMKKPIELVLKRNKWKNESAIEVQGTISIRINSSIMKSCQVSSFFLHCRGGKNRNSPGCSDLEAAEEK